MESSAYLKQVRIAPRKAAFVADLIRGKGVNEAFSALKFMPRKNVAHVFTQLIKSAAANAQESGKINVDSLFVHKVIVNKGQTMKRWRPRAMGRASRILKRSSHIEIVLADEK